MKIKGNKAIVTNGAIETVYEIQPNGDLLKMSERVGKVIIWTRPEKRINAEA